MVDHDSPHCRYSSDVVLVIDPAQNQATQPTADIRAVNRNGHMIL
jgi:hypothetical protein